MRRNKAVDKVNLKFKNSEKQLLELATVVNQTAEGIAIANNSGNIVYVNNAWTRLHGYRSSEKLKGKHLSIFHTKKQLKDEVIPFNKLLKIKDNHSGEVGHMRKNGTIFPTLMITTNLKDSSGKKYGMAGFMQDITKYKRIEEDLRRSEANLRTLVNTIPDLVWMKDPKGAYVICNKRVASLFGSPMSNILGKTDYDFVDKKLADYFKKKDREAIAASKPTMNEEEVIFAIDGHKEILETIKTPIYDTEGHITGVLGIARDITERKQAEEALKASETRFRELFNNMSSCVAVYKAIENGNDFKFIDFNKAAEKTEKIKRKDIIGKKVTEVFPDVKRFGIFKIFKRVWKTGISENHPISQYKDNRIIGWRDNFIYKLPTGEIVALYDDITEQKKTEETVKEVEDMKRFNKFVINRELKMIELKKEMKELKKQLKAKNNNK